MSKIFYDHLIILEELEHHVKNVCETTDEREELWNLIDEIIHHRVLGCIMDKLSHEHHDEFLCRFHEAPYDGDLISYINDKLDIEENIEDTIKKELESLTTELLGSLLE
jgi:hypothetical protein